MAAIYVLDVPEFQSLIEVAGANPAYRVKRISDDYFRIESDTDLVFKRKDLRMKPAVWYGCFTGGLEGNIAEFGRDEVRVTA